METWQVIAAGAVYLVGGGLLGFIAGRNSKRPAKPHGRPNGAPMRSGPGPRDWEPAAAQATEPPTVNSDGSIRFD